MALGFGEIGSALGTWMRSGVFWLIFAIIATIGAVILLNVNKRRKLKYSALEIISYGNGKVGIHSLKVGIFKKKTAIFGLWDYGNESCFKTDDGRQVLEATTDDLHDIFGKKGFLLRRKDDDHRILVPITGVDWKGEQALFEIAPADFRDASVNIIDTATKETNSWADKYLPYIMLAGMVIFFIVGFILAAQFFNRTVDKAGEILTKVSQNALSVRQGVSP